MARVQHLRQLAGLGLLAAGVWIALAAVFAMHGLPMQQPHVMPATNSASIASPMSEAMFGSMSTTSMSAQHAPATSSTASTRHHDAAADTGHEAAPAAAALATRPLDAGTASPVPAGACSDTDHCQVSLRGHDQLPGPAVVAVITRTASPTAAAVLAAGAGRPAELARPPDLDTLQISRT